MAGNIKRKGGLGGYWEQAESQLDVWFQLSLLVPCKKESPCHQILAFQKEPEIQICVRIYEASHFLNVDKEINNFLNVSAKEILKICPFCVFIIPQLKKKNL